MKKKPIAIPASVIGMSPMELARRIPLADAAAHNGVHPQTFRKNYPHLIKKVGQRRDFVTVYDAIMLPPPAAE
jgi:hypothetical protein